jgi:hypothetical protein
MFLQIYELPLKVQSAPNKFPFKRLVSFVTLSDYCLKIFMYLSIQPIVGKCNRNKSEKPLVETSFDTLRYPYYNDEINYSKFNSTIKQIW